MKKVFVKGMVFFAALTLLAACQNIETAEHHHTEHENAEKTEMAVIEGASDHYHSGDMLELTASAESVTGEHWHWYISNDGTDWKVIDGEQTDTLRVEAQNGQYIKAMLYDENHEIEAESEPVKISIDDHTSDIYEGYFEDNQIEDRSISDWAGQWQSVYPYLESGALDEVFDHKAETSDMTAVEYKEYYRDGYETDVTGLNITDNGEFTFEEEDDTFTGKYEYDGHEVLVYEAGNRGVRYIFKKTEGDDKAPQYIQFSDHIIAPDKSGHFHLYWGEDREALLEEVSHWPTYYPAEQTEADIKKDMLKH